MNPTYMIWLDEREQGPINLAELEARCRVGAIQRGTLVRGALAGDWIPCEKLLAGLESDRVRQEKAQRQLLADQARRERAPAGALDALHDGVFSGLTFFGCLLLLAGLGLFFGAAVLDTAPGGTVENIGRLNLRMCLCIVAATSFLGGCIFLAAAFVRDHHPKRR